MRKESAARRWEYSTPRRCWAGYRPPATVIMQLARGWRTMFVVIGLAGIVVGLCWYVGYRNRRQFTLQEEEQQYLASEEAARPALKFSEWLALFKRRTTGMILGFSGVNYTGWLYIARLPGYLQAQQGLSPPVPAGWRRSRFLPRRWGCGSTARWSMPRRAEATIRRKPAKRRLLSVWCCRRWAPCWWCNRPRQPGGGFYLHGAVLRSFCRDVRTGAGAGNGGGA